MLEDCDEVAALEGDRLYANRNKVWKVVLQVFHTLLDLDSIIFIVAGPFALFLPWLYNIINRLLAMLVEYGQEKEAKKRCTEAIREFKELERTAKDPKKKKKNTENVFKSLKIFQRLL